MIKPFFPVVLSWELTLACNLRCQHCGSACTVARNDELTPAESLALCDQFSALLVQEVDFTGGEPLLRPDWPAIAEKLVGLGIIVQIITNGARLTRDVIRQMKSVGISQVGVSLDGLEDTHDRIRGSSGLFQRVMRGIEFAQEVDLTVSVLTTVNGHNVCQLPEMVHVLRGVGIDRWQIQPIFPLGRAPQTPGLVLTVDQYRAMAEFVRIWHPRALELGLEIAPADSYGYFTPYDVREVPWRGCPAGRVACGLTSDGKVKGCLSLPDEYIEGDLRERDLWEIWFDPESFAYTRQYNENSLGPNCQGCGFAEQCMGGCSAMSIGGTGQFHNCALCLHSLLELDSAQLRAVQ